MEITKKSPWGQNTFLLNKFLQIFYYLIRPPVSAKTSTVNADTALGRLHQEINTKKQTEEGREVRG